MGRHLEHLKSIHSCPGDYCIAPNSNSSGTKPPMTGGGGDAREAPPQKTGNSHRGVTAAVEKVHKD